MNTRWLAMLSSVILTTPAFAAVDWSDELERTSKWLVARQDAGGGINESEYFSYFYQIDTVRAIATWNDYQAFTGDTQFLPNVQLAWTYVLATPSFNEPNPYTRLESCGWSLKAEKDYSRLNGDNSFEAYAIQCADYIKNNPPNFALDSEFLAAGQAALFLFEWAVDRNDSVRKSAAEDLALLLKAEIEAAPSRLNKEVAEESGGMVFSAIVDVAFASDLDARKAWVETYASNLETYLTSGIYNNSHNSWYGRAHNLAWEYAVEKSSHDKMWAIAQDQLAQDHQDHDGAIPRKSTDNPQRDGTWSTEVRDTCALPPIFKSADVALATSDSTIPVGTDLLIDFGLANNLDTGALVFLVAFLDIPGFGPRFLGAFPFNLPLGFAFAVNNIHFNVPTGSPKGDWRIRLFAHDGTGKQQDQAILSFKVQ